MDGDTPKSFQQTADGGYIIGGYSFSDISGDKTQPSWGHADYWIVKIDSLGNKQWDKRFGGIESDVLYSLQQTSGGGYILGGASRSEIGGDKTQPSWGGGSDDDYWIVKIDSLGNKQWDKRFGGTYYDALYSLQQTVDGGYILGGRSVSDSSGDKTEDSWGFLEDYWVVKTDALGNKQWDKRFGGIGTEQLTELKQTHDKGYILGGYSNSDSSGNKTQISRGDWDFWVVKIDSLGNKEWDKRFGTTERDYLNSLTQTVDRGYILGGLVDSMVNGDRTQQSRGELDYWIVKIDSNGNKEWDKNYGGIKSEDDFGRVVQTFDGGYLLSGTSYSTTSGDKTENNSGEEQPWIVKTDSLGNIQWDKTIFNGVHDEMGNAIQTRDTCYVIVTDNGSALLGGVHDYIITKYCFCRLLVTISSFTSQVTYYGASDGAAKVIASGGVAPYSFLWSDGQTTDLPTGFPAGTHAVTVTDAWGCTTTTSITIKEGPTGIVERSFQDLSLFPNPTNGIVAIKAGISSFAGMEFLSIKLYDALGRQLLNQTIDNSLQEDISLDLKELPGNIFFLGIVTEAGKRVVKVVKY